jgi:hypothetical protein
MTSKKLFVLLIALLGFASLAQAQNTQVTGTVVDPGGIPYASGTGHVNLVCPGNQQPMIGSAPIPRSYTIPALDGLGSFSTGLFDVNVMTPAGCGYQFIFADACQVASFTTPVIGFATDAIPITGTGPVNMSGEINNSTVPVSSQCKAQQGGGLTLLTLASSATPAFNSGVNTAWKFTLNQNVTSSTFTTTGKPGTIFQVDLLEGGTGGFTFAFPGNVVLPANFVFDTTAGHHNQLAFIWDGSTWNPWQVIGSSGGGGGSPGAPVNSLQKNCSGAFCAANITDDGTTLSLLENAVVTASNSFTVGGVTKFLGDFHPTGPNPYVDIMNFGGYVGNTSTPQSTTCTTTSGLTSMTLAAAKDFANGQGIVCYGAGSLPTIPVSPTVNTVTPANVANGSTIRDYKVAAEDYFGGIRAAGGAGGTTLSAATMGATTVSLTGVVRANGVDTYTCAANCNLTVGAQIQLSGFNFATNSLVNGTVIVVSTPSSTTFTVNASGLADYTESGSETMSTQACNRVYETGALAQESTVLRYWIYRRDAGVGNYNLAGVAIGQDPYFEDCGQGVSGVVPSYVPATAPAADIPGYLVTTIVSGAPGTSIVVANAAGTSQAGGAANHDNSSALKAAWAAAYSAHGGIVVLPPIPNNSFNSYPFYASTNLASVSNATAAQNRLLFAEMNLNQPLIVPTYSEFSGIPQSAGTSFNYTPLGVISGSSTPFIMINHNGGNAVRFANIKFACAGSGQTSILSDESIGGGGNVGIIFDDVGACGANASAIVVKGGFDFWFNRGSYGVTGTEGGQYFAHPSVLFTPGSPYIAPSSTQNAGRVIFDKVNFVGGGTAIQLDTLPYANAACTNVSGGGNIVTRNVLDEGNVAPMLRVLTGCSFGFGITVDNSGLADQANGLHQPVVEFGTTTGFTLINLRGAFSGGANPAVLGGGTSLQATCQTNQFIQGCGPTSNQILQGANHFSNGGQIQATNNGNIGIPISTPAVAVSCVVQAGGSMTVGNHVIALAAVDSINRAFTTSPYNHLSLLSPTCSFTTTGGNQSVLITFPTPPGGTTGWVPWLDGAESNLVPTTGSCQIALPLTATFTYAAASTCSASAPTIATAYSNGVTPNGIKGTNYIGGGAEFSFSTATKTSGYTATVNDFYIPSDPASGSFAITIPHNTAGQTWVILNTNITGTANTLTVQPDSGLIDNSANIPVPNLNAVWVTCDFTNCHSTAKTGSGGGGGGTINNAAQFSFPYYCGAGSNNQICGVAPPTTNGLYLEGYQVVGGVAVAPSVFQLGIPYIAEATTTHTLATAERAADINFQAQATATLTLPAITGQFGQNFPFAAMNNNSSNLTTTATAPNTIDGGSAGGSITSLPGWLTLFRQDNSPNWFTRKIPTFSAFPSCDSGLTFLGFNLSTGFKCNAVTLSYQLVGNNGASQTARNRINFIPGTNITFSFADNAGTNSTDFTINASGGAGNPCTTTALSFQYNNGGAFGCAADFTLVAAHTFTMGAAGLVDLTAGVANSFKVPIIAGATSGADGVIAYDSTNKNTHVRTNGADSIVGAFSAAPTTGHVVDTTVSGGNTLLHDSGIASSQVVTATTAAATGAGQIPYSQGNNRDLLYASLSPATLTDGATVTWAIGSVPMANSSLTFTVHGGSRTLNLTGLVTGGTYVLRLVQDATGGENLTGGTGCTWKQLGGGGTSFTLTGTANAIDILTFYYDGTSCYANIGKNYS